MDSTSWIPFAATREPPRVRTAQTPASGTGKSRPTKPVSAASVPDAPIRRVTWLRNERLLWAEKIRTTAPRESPETAR